MYLKGAQIDPKNILTEWNGREGKFVRTFGINDTRNNNEWRSTWDGIENNISTALGRPGIEFTKCDEKGCSLDHVEAESFEENVEKQKPFERSTIIDYVIDEDNHSADVIHEVHDDEFWEKIKSGKIKYVSPMIWPYSGGAQSNGTGRADLPVIDTWDWQWVHTAFLEENPAFGDVANVKTTCEGKNCGVQLLTAKQLKAKDDNPMCGNCIFFVENHTCKLVKDHIAYKDLCDLHAFGKTNPPGTKINPKYEKPEVNYRTPLAATTADPSTTTLTPLKEIPLLYRHKGSLHLISTSSCVQEIIKKKKDAGIEIDDQALAIAYSECGESAGLKSSFKTCTCEKNQDMDPEQHLVELKSKLKATEDEKKDLEAKLKAQDEKDEKYKATRKARYAKMFAATNNEDDEKHIMAAIKATEDKEDLKAAQEELKKHQEAKKAQTEDPEKKELQAANKAMQASLAKPLVASLVAVRKGKLTESELTEYENTLKAKSFTDIQKEYDNEKYLMVDTPSLAGNTLESGLPFPGEQTSHSLSAKSIDDILEDPQVA